MTANADLMDEAVRLGLILDQLAAHSFNRVQERLQILRDELGMLVLRLDPTALMRDGNRRYRLEVLVDEARQAIEAAYAGIETQVEQDLEDAAVLTQDSLSAALAALLLFRGLSRQLDEAGRKSARDDTLIAGGTMSQWWQAQAQDLSQRTGRVLSDAMRLTQLGREPSTGDLVKAIRDTGPGTLFAAAPRNAEGLIRSAYHAVANRVRYEIILRHPELFRAFQHISVLDGKTTSICRSRANRLWNVDGSPIGHGLIFQRPPLHFACRSHLIGVLHGYKDMPTKMQKRISREFFSDAAAPEPSLKEWLDMRGEQQDAEPMNYQDARKRLGLA